MANFVLTPNDILELERCSEDPVYFIEKYVKVYHPVKGLIPFHLFPKQVEVIEAYHANKKVVHLHARQVGGTVLGCAYLLWRAIFLCNQKMMILVPRFVDVKESVSKLREMFNNLPSIFKGSGLSECNNRRIRVEDTKSAILLSVFQPNALRGLALDLIWFADASYYRKKNEQDLEEMFHYPLAATRWIISTGGKPDTDIVNRIYYGAVNGQNDFVAVKTLWNDCWNRNDNFKRDMINILGREKWDVEYEVAVG